MPKPKGENYKPRNEPYRLSWLNYNLHQNGIRGKCFDYKLSSNGDALCLVYLDYLCREQFIQVHRTSRLIYKIYYNGKSFTEKTAKAATLRIENIFDEIISNSPYYSNMSVKEFMDSNKLTHWQKIDIENNNRSKYFYNKVNYPDKFNDNSDK